MVTMKPINCSCGAVLFKRDELMIEESIVVKCGKCGVLQRVSIVIISQIKVEPVKVD